MRRYATLALALSVLATGSAVGIAGAAGGEGPVTVKVGELELTSQISFSPKIGSATKQTPLAVRSSGEVREEDGGHPPAARELVIEADKYGEVHTEGIPACKSGQLQATETSAALRACRPALIGQGQAVVQVALPEQRPIDVTSKLLLFNGGEKGGRTIWYAHAYFTSPVSGAIVTTVTITKIHRGRFGTLAVVKIPQIVGGSGSGISFNLEIFKTVKFKGQTFNPISGRCADGKVKFHVEAKFENGTKAQSELVRACTARR